MELPDGLSTTVSGQKHKRESPVRILANVLYPNRQAHQLMPSQFGKAREIQGT